MRLEPPLPGERQWVISQEAAEAASKQVHPKAIGEAIERVSRPVVRAQPPPSWLGGAVCDAGGGKPVARPGGFVLRLGSSRISAGVKRIPNI